LVALTAHLLNLNLPDLRADPTPERPRPVVPRQLQRQLRLEEREILQLISDYVSGASVPELAARYQIHRTTVIEHLQRHAIPRRPQTRKLTDAQVEEAAQRYASGVSTIQLGQHYGVDTETIRKELHRAGVQLRPARGRPR
jgi:transposase